MFAWFVTALAAPSGALIDPAGSDHLERIEELRFTFVVERDGAVAAQRSWTWRPREGTVTRRSPGDPVTFRAFHPEGEAQREADEQFVNDSFWLAPHLHVAWAGDGVRLEDRGDRPLPVGEGTAREVVVRFPSEGGYTPGDRYDLYLRLGRVVAWTYHRGGTDEPTLSTTFEAPVHLGPLALATDHRDAAGHLRIRFTDLGLVLAPGVATLAPVTGERAGDPLVEVWDGGCRIRGSEVPFGGEPPPAPTPGEGGPWDTTLEARVADRAVRIGVRSDTLALSDPSVVGSTGFQRCELRAADQALFDALLDGASREERSALLALALETWTPRTGPSALAGERLHQAALACATDGACDDVRAMVVR